MHKANFFDEVHDFQRFIIKNIYLLGRYTILSQQLSLHSNENGIIDILALDLDENRITIIELKNEKMLDKGLWQPLRYYDLLRRGEDSLRELLFNCRLGISINEIDLNPKVLLVVPKCNEQLLRSISYFEEIDLKLIELKRTFNGSFFDIRKKIFYPSNIIHRDNLTEVSNKVHVDWSFDEYIKKGLNKEKVNLAKRVVFAFKKAFIKKSFEFDVFFAQSIITITKNGKVFAKLKIKQNPHSDYLSLSINNHNNINRSHLIYTVGLEKYSFSKDKVNLTFSFFPDDDFFEFCV